MKKGVQKIRLEIISDDNDKSSLGKGEKIIVFNNMSDCASDSVNVWFSKTQDKNNKTKDVTIELNDGNKTVTVTTQENGKEKTKVYTGKEAEKYLKGMKKAKFFN